MTAAVIRAFNVLDIGNQPTHSPQIARVLMSNKVLLLLRNRLSTEAVIAMPFILDA